MSGEGIENEWGLNLVGLYIVFFILHLYATHSLSLQRT